MTKVSSVRPRTLWALERITALCLIPLGLWFALHLPRFQSLSREAFVSWCKEPLHLALLAAFLDGAGMADIQPSDPGPEAR